VLISLLLAEADKNSPAVYQTWLPIT